MIAWFCIRPRRSTRIAVGLVFLCIVGWWITIPEERQQQLEEEISKLQANVDLLKVESFSRQQVMNDPNYLQEAWPRLDQTENCKIIECVINKIVITRDEIEIDLCHLPSSEDMSKRDRSLHDSV